METKRKKVGIVFGGGGAKSFAHMGVVKVFEENDIPIDVLTTCSGGSIIGALIACGISIEDIKKEFYKITKKINWLRPNVSTKGFLSQKNIKNILFHFCGNKNIEDLNISLSIVATNLSKGKLKVFTKGNLIEAVCASSAFPGIYPPVEIDGELYVDGGVLNSIPADVCRNIVGKDNVVISISLDESLQEVDKNNVFSIVHKSIYIPILKRRQHIIRENSDININIFEDRPFNIKNWRDILRFYSEKKMEYFFRKGEIEANKVINDIKKIIYE